MRRSRLDRLWTRTLMPPTGHVFLVFTMRAQGPFRHGSRIGPARAGALKPPAQGAADLGSLAGFVLEGELELGPIGDRPALVQVNVLLDDLGHPQITERPGGSPDRLRCCVFP